MFYKMLALVAVHSTLSLMICGVALCAENAVLIGVHEGQSGEAKVVQALEAAQPETAPDLIDDGRPPRNRINSAPVTLNPQPLPPKSAEKKTSGATPVERVTLNPQPLPPKATEMMRPRDTAVLPNDGEIRGAQDNRPTSLRQSPSAKRASTPIDAEGREQFELRCRGGGELAISDVRSSIDTASAAKTDRRQRSLQQLSFLPSNRNARGNSPPAGADGGGLKPSTCAFADRPFTLAYPVGVVFDASSTAPGIGSIRNYLADANHFWTFTVYDTKYGTFRATSHGPWTPSRRVTGTQPPISVPAELFSMDDRAIIIVGGKEQRAGAVKKDVRAALRKASGTPVQLTSVRPPPPATTVAPVPASTTIQGSATMSPQVARATQSHAVAAASRAGTTIAGTSTQPPARTAASLEVDCVSQQPHLVQPRERLTPGSSFKLEGTCFGGRGVIEVQGDFGRRDTLELAPTNWTAARIDFLFPQLSGVHDQAVTVSVVRADGKRSIARVMPFVAERHLVQVPAEKWTPTASLEHTESVDFSGVDIGGAPGVYYGQLAPLSLAASVAVSPLCALEGVSAISRSGSIDALEGWDRPGPPHLGSVTVKGKPICVTKVDKYEFVLAGYSEAKEVCTMAVDLSATASCPAGLSP